MSSADAETLLKKIRKLEGNRSCPNCSTPAPTGLGFGNICVKVNRSYVHWGSIPRLPLLLLTIHFSFRIFCAQFKTFVCDMCKTSHQAISHRCKSVSMSTWTMEEVRALTGEEGGGNDAARHIWLASAPAPGGRYPGGTRPKQGDRIDIFKQFVIDCYEKGMFKATSPYVYNGTGSNGSASPVARPAASSAPVPIVAAAPAPQIDLLDTSFAAAPAPANLKIDVQQSSWGQNDAFGNSFGTTQPGASANFSSFDAFAAPPSAAPSGGDMFAGFQIHGSPMAAKTTGSTPIARTNSNSSGDFFGSSPTAFQAPAPAIPAPSHDPFGSALLVPMSGVGSAPMGVNPSAMSASPLTMSSSGGISPRPMMMSAGPPPVASTQQQFRSGMAISSLMGPAGANMGMRGPVGSGFNGSGVAMPPQKDSFDFVRDTMGGSRGSPMAGGVGPANFAVGGAAISAMGPGIAIGGMQSRGPMGSPMGAPISSPMGMGGVPVGMNGGASVMNSGRNMMTMASMPSPQQMQMQSQQNQRSGFGFM